MIPAFIIECRYLKTCPHTRGDDPHQKTAIEYTGELVPIRVGMIPYFFDINILPSSCPHTRGDDPHSCLNFSLRENLSPYAWG